jgi:hypothetical protein
VGGIGRPLKLFFVRFESADCIFFSLEELWIWACVGKEETKEVNYLLEFLNRRGLIALGFLLIYQHPARPKHTNTRTTPDLLPLRPPSARARRIAECDMYGPASNHERIKHA